MITIKKCFIGMVITILLLACNNQRPYQKYHDVVNMMIANKDNFTMFDSNMYEAIANYEYREEKYINYIQIDGAIIQLDKICLLALDKNELTSKTDKIYPSFGIINNIDESLRQKDDMVSNHKLGIVLLFSSTSIVEELAFYFSYSVDGELHEDFYYLTNIAN